MVGMYTISRVRKLMIDLTYNLLSRYIMIKIKRIIYINEEEIVLIFGLYKQGRVCGFINLSSPWLNLVPCACYYFYIFIKFILEFSFAFIRNFKKISNFFEISKKISKFSEICNNKKNIQFLKKNLD